MLCHRFHSIEMTKGFKKTGLWCSQPERCSGAENSNASTCSEERKSGSLTGFTPLIF